MRTGLSTGGAVLVRVVVVQGCLELSRCSRPLQPDGDTHGGTGKAGLPRHLQLKLLCLAPACTVLQGHHCWENSWVLLPSTELQMFQGLTSVPMHHANSIFTMCFCGTNILITP